jgi:signal transduction histidine kinase/CheY-like chemotaxis protein
MIGNRSRAAAKGFWRGFLQRLRAGSTIIFRPGALEEAQEQARLAERRLREAIDALPEGIVFLDAEGRYVMWNRRYAEIYERSADLFREGVKLEDTLRIGIARGDYPQAVGREEAWLAERLDLLKNPGVRHEQQLANGRWIMIEERLTQAGGIIGLRVDITDMKAQAQKLEDALEEARAAGRAKDDFLANMSHEIRTPLNGVIGLADVLSRTPLDPGQKDLLRTLSASAQDLNALLSDLLDFSKLEAGKLAIEAAPFDLARLAADCAALFRPSAAAKGVALAVSAAPTGHVLGDAGRVKQIVTNLLSNAVKFTVAGRVDLRIGQEGPGVWVIEVVDTGCGFPPEAAERLFGRFEQADASTTRRFGGTGLGLSICRQLAELMGGAVSAVGRPGEGATFTVRLTLPPVEAPAAVDETAALEDCPQLRVLVVDDNAVNRKVVTLMLAQIGAEVVACEDGREGVEAFSREAFDLVLMDLQMPVMDGLAATRAIRAMQQGGPVRTPVVVLSANVSADDRRASADAGADAHVGKPIRADELIAAMMDVLGDQAEAAAAAA